MNLRDRAVSALQRGRRYGTSMGWTFRHGLLRRRMRTAGLIGLSIVSLATQAAAIGVVFLYVRYMESGESIPWLHIPQDWIRSYYGLLAVVTIVGILLAATHVSLYRTRMISIDWSRDHERYCGRLALSCAARLPDLSRPNATGSATDPKLQRLLTVDARYCGLVVRLMVLALPSLVALLGSIVMLVALDWAITAIIMSLGSAIFLFQYPVSLRGAEATVRWQKARSEAIRQTSAVIARQRLGNREGKDDAPSDLYSHPTVSQSIEAYADRMRAIEVGTFATQVGTTLLIAAIILFIGDRALRGDAEWAFLISYVTLLRVASGSFSGLARQVSSMARLYPQVQNFVRFVTAAKSSEVQELLRRPDSSLRLHFAHGEKGESGASVGRVELSNGETAALVTRGLRATARPDFAVALAAEVGRSRGPIGSEDPGAGNDAATGRASGEGTSGAVVLIAAGRMAAGLVPREALALPPDMTTGTWRAALERLRQARADLDEAIGFCAGMDLDEPAKRVQVAEREGLVAQVAAALARRASVVIVERTAFTALGCRDASDPLVQLLKDGRLLMVWYEQVQVGATFSPQFGERTLLVCAGTTLEAAIDLHAADAAERIESLLVQPPDRARAAAATEDDALADLI